MTLIIKNQDVENLLKDIVKLTGETKTEAIRKALEERHRQLFNRSLTPNDEERLLHFLENEIWPQIPAELLGTHLTKAEEDNILGYSEN
jgi:antitoxin VapB